MTRPEVGTRHHPWLLDTPSRTSTFQAYVDIDAEPAALVCRIGATIVSYQLRCLGDLYTMLRRHRGWIPLGIADEKGCPPDGTIEAWARSNENPVGGWYGLKRHWRGRFAMYVPPLLEHLRYIELEHYPADNRARALASRHPILDEWFEPATLPGVFDRSSPEQQTRYLELMRHDPVVGMAYLEGLGLTQVQAND
jgi:hypothetical protein